MTPTADHGSTIATLLLDGGGELVKRDDSHEALERFGVLLRQRWRKVLVLIISHT